MITCKGWSRIAQEKIKFLVNQGGTVNAIVIADPIRGAATVDKFGKVTWKDQNDDLPLRMEK